MTSLSLSALAVATEDGPRARLFRYRAYGLSIASELEIGALPADSGANAADVEIRLRPVHHAQDTLKDDPAIEFSPGLQILSWPSVASFAIHDGAVIDVALADHPYRALYQVPLLGAVFATLLHQRGVLVLHASAVEIEGKGVAFIGQKGMGKSTLAAAFLRAGHRLVADDVLAIDFSTPGQPVVIPGFPEIKLNQDVNETVTLFATDSARPHPDFPKVQKRLSNNFCATPTPLAAIYVLGDDKAAHCQALAPGAQFAALLGHSYMSRFAGRTSDADPRARLLQYAALLESVPVRQLGGRGGLGRLDERVRLVADDLKSRG